VGLDLSQFFRTNKTEAGQSVGSSALEQFFQAGQFIFVRGDDHFSANLVRNLMLAAELDHGRRSGYTKAGFQRSGLVVNTGMNHAAIVSTLMARDAVFFFDEQQPLSRESTRDFQSYAEADGSPTDDDDVVPRIGHVGAAGGIPGDHLVYDEGHNRALAGIGLSSGRGTGHDDLVSDRRSWRTATASIASGTDSAAGD